jgi:predicted transcriptional regulator of viral defense system
MNTLSGIGKLDRQRLAEIIRGTKGVISVSEATAIIQMTASNTAKLLSRWNKKGWLSRLRRGQYAIVPLESKTVDVVLEDPFAVAEKLFGPCYIGGWSAAEHWGLTEQIFRSIIVITAQIPRKREQTIKGTTFLLKSVSTKKLFGLKSVWKGQVKVSISDPSRSIVDLLDDPILGGGIRPAADIFLNYLKSDKRDLKSLLGYAKELGNGAVFKRLGFLLERYEPNETEIIDTCRANLSKGNSKLDPGMAADALVTRWRLWVPKNWAKRKIKKGESVDLP